MGTGTFEGGSWQVVAEVRGQDVCVNTRFSDGAGDTSICIPDGDDVPLTTHGSSGGASRPDIVHGLTRADVASVKVETRGGAQQVTTVEVPVLRAAPISRRGFAVVVPAHSVLVAITAFDAAGRVLERQEMGLPN